MRGFVSQYVYLYLTRLMGSKLNLIGIFAHHINISFNFKDILIARYLVHFNIYIYTRTWQILQERNYLKIITGSRLMCYYFRNGCRWYQITLNWKYILFEISLMVAFCFDGCSVLISLKKVWETISISVGQADKFLGPFFMPVLHKTNCRIRNYFLFPFLILRASENFSLNEN